jgi:uncharacterized membrane protein YedE/YeeE
VDIGLTAYLWLNLLLAGLLFGVGFTLAGLLVNGVLGLARRGGH